MNYNVLMLVGIILLFIHQLINERYLNERITWLNKIVQAKHFPLSFHDTPAGMAVSPILHRIEVKQRRSYRHKIPVHKLKLKRPSR